MNFCVHFLVLTILLARCVYSQQPCRQFERATENLREVIIGSCTMYQQNVNQPVFCTEGFRNCTKIWEAFSEAFMFQPRCNVDDKRLDKFISLTDHSIPRDKSLFWENVFPFVIQYSNGGMRYYALSNTLPGYIGNGPQWCSNPDDPTGMDPPGSICPGWEPTPDCHQSAQRAFWIAASRNFGLRASGEIFIMLNATFNPIFANDTYLAVYELPSLRENIVTKATVLLLNERPVEGQTKCDDPTLSALPTILTPKRIKYACIENRRDLVETFCLNFPTSEVCKVLEEKTSSAPITASSVSAFFISSLMSVITLTTYIHRLSLFF